MQKLEIWKLSTEIQAIVFKRGNGVKDCKLYINDKKLKQIDEFIYHSRMFTIDGKIDGEI